MTISKKRAEELRNKLLVRLKTDSEQLLSEIIDEAGKDPMAFLFGYVSQLKKDLRAARGQSSSESYVHLDFPLNKRDFTEEELEYLGFYKDNVFYADK